MEIYAKGKKKKSYEEDREIDQEVKSKVA